MSGLLFEAAYALHIYPRYIHGYAKHMAGFLIGAMLVILLVFPYIFKGEWIGLSSRCRVECAK